MNKKVIWIIVGVTSLAVFGVIWSQVNVVLTSIKAMEEKFEDNVSESLSIVARLLEQEEKREYQRHTINGYSIKFPQKSGVNQRISSLDIQFESGLTSIDLIADQTRQIIDHRLHQFIEDDLCPKCKTKKSLFYLDYDYAENQGNASPLEERVQPQKIKEMLDQEFTNRGIDIDYHFGVYSIPKKSWVLIDDHFLYEEREERGTLPGVEESKEASSYEAFLFPSTIPSPGFLVVQFPAKSTFLWRSLMNNLIGTILFAAIILGCFFYSVNVIFRQKKISEMKTDFINNMTHEFKTPIATISLAADSITSPMVASHPDKIQRFAKIIKQENKRMNSQVEKVLQMALIDKREFSLKLSDLNLHSIVHRAVENISLQVEKREGEALMELNAENPVIEGDSTHISNIVNNLLDNANKYTPENPKIVVQTRNVSNGVEVIVKDNGVGMTKEAKKHIFDKFYRVHTGDLHDVKGFGLGLSYVKAMMTAHKGHIDVKSELGKGSSFILFFPYRVNS